MSYPFKSLLYLVSLIFGKLNTKTLTIILADREGGRGQWAVYFTSLQSFMIMISYSLTEQYWSLLFTFYGLVHHVQCPIISTTE